MDDYDDIKKRLSPLNEITIPAEKEQEIANAVRQVAQTYRDGKLAPVGAKGTKWFGSASAVAVATAGMIVMLHTRPPTNTSNTSAKTTIRPARRML